MSKSSRTSAKKKTHGKTRRPQAVRASSLAITEPRLRLARTAGKPRTAQDARAQSADSPSAAGRMVEFMLTWSPMNIALRQQAMLASLLPAPSPSRTSQMRSRSSRHKS